MKNKLVIGLLSLGMAIPAFAASQQTSFIQDKQGLFIGEYSTRADYIAHGTELNGKLADEGFTLLKNDGTLPLASGSRISVFGKSSINLARGGAGSGAGSVSSGITSINLQQSLTDAGFEVNPDLTNFYNNSSLSGRGRTNGNDGWQGNSEVTVGETPLDNLPFYSSDEYDDLAIQVITREGSEGCDLLTIDATDSTKFGYSEKHVLELSDNEQELYEMLKTQFEHILIIINSSNIFECDQFMQDEECAGILWIGNPGDVGLGAVGRILSGEVNPSGHTVDTWTRDFTKDPTFQNFSDNRQHGEAIPNTANRLKHASLDTMFASDGAPMLSYGTDRNYTNHNSPRWKEEAQKVVQGGINGVKPASYVSYEEDIYMDYRYYETRYADLVEKQGVEEADTWYNGEEGVVFPFGYGLSYTEFEQEIVRIKPAQSSTLDENSDLIEVSVKVTNTGNVAGKDSVQLYWKAPYFSGEIEKADHVLCAFDKTKLLAPRETQTLHLTFHLQDVANYDYLDANGNNHKGYELDEGKHSILLNKNAHETYDKIDLQVKEGGIQYLNDRVTGNEVQNRFTDRGFMSSLPGENDIEFTKFSRANFADTFPTFPTIEDRTVKAGSRIEEFLTHEFNIWDIEEDSNFDMFPESIIVTEQEAAAKGFSQQNTTLSKANRTQLIDMKGVSFDDPRWDSFLNEFTWDELMSYVERYGMRSPANSNIGKPGGSEGDGPQKFNIMWWVSSPIIAATFNPRLAHEQGECVGMESQISGKSGWWGPAVNLHRSPFGGRNFEYYSADPFLSGKIATQIIGAATDRGILVYFKHFAVTEQEKNREGVMTFVGEQALRELYLKPFQIVVQEGKATGLMGSYNRLGLIETAANYGLNTEILRNEWGFKGSILSDLTHSGNGSVNNKCYECVTTRALSGQNCQLDSGGFSGQTASKWDSSFSWTGGTGAPCYTKTGEVEKKVSFTWWNAVREAVKGHLYSFAGCTQMAQGVTRVVHQSELQFQVGEAVNIQCALPDDMSQFTTKEISSTTYRLNERVELPAGIVFNNGVISGAFQNVCLARIDVIAEVDFNDGSQGAFALKYIIDAVPDMGNTGLKNVDATPASKDDTLMNVSLIGLVSLIPVPILLVLLKKKTKKEA